MGRKLIAVDFDGTVVEHDFPRIGKSLGAEPVLKELIYNGFEFVLWTMRCGQSYQDAKNWYKEREIPILDYEEIMPSQTWTTSPKPFAQLFIDDSGLGIPLNEYKDKPHSVDWVETRRLLIKQGFIKISPNQSSNCKAFFINANKFLYVCTKHCDPKDCLFYGHDSDYVCEHISSTSMDGVWFCHNEAANDSAREELERSWNVQSNNN